MGGPPLAGADASCRGSCGDGDDADNRRREAMLAEAEAPMARVEAMLLMRGGRWTRLRLRRVAVDQAMAENPAWRGMVMADPGWGRRKSPKRWPMPAATAGSRLETGAGWRWLAARVPAPAMLPPPDALRDDGLDGMLRAGGSAERGSDGPARRPCHDIGECRAVTSQRPVPPAHPPCPIPEPFPPPFLGEPPPVAGAARFRRFRGRPRSPSARRQEGQAATPGSR
jgi:hypothetical protein